MILKMLRFFALGSVGALAVSAPADAPLLEQLRKTRSIFPSLQENIFQLVPLEQKELTESEAALKLHLSLQGSAFSLKTF